MNVIEAAASGASNAIPLVANIAANLIAFLAFLAFIDAILSYIGSMVDHPEVSFKVGLRHSNVMHNLFHHACLLQIDSIFCFLIKLITVILF